MRRSALVVALLLAGCRSQWYLQHDQSDVVTTNLLVETDPTGADVAFDGVRQARAPVRIPVKYTHTEQLWTRQTNAGAEMRDSWPPLLQVIGFPVWGIASFFHYTDDTRRHVYSGNVHDVSATLPGRTEAVERVTLEGEDEVRVQLTLPPRAPAAGD